MSLDKVPLTEKQARETVNALEFFVSNMPLSDMNKKNYWLLIKKFKKLYQYKKKFTRGDGSYR